MPAERGYYSLDGLFAITRTVRIDLLYVVCHGAQVRDNTRGNGAEQETTTRVSVSSAKSATRPSGCFKIKNIHSSSKELSE